MPGRGIRLHKADSTYSRARPKNATFCLFQSLRATEKHSNQTKGCRIFPVTLSVDDQSEDDVSCTVTARFVLRRDLQELKLKYATQSFARWAGFSTCWNCGWLTVPLSSSSDCGRLSPLGRCGISLACTSLLARMGIIASGVTAVDKSTASLAAAPAVPLMPDKMFWRSLSCIAPAWRALDELVVSARNWPA